MPKAVGKVGKGGSKLVSAGQQSGDGALSGKLATPPLAMPYTTSSLQLQLAQQVRGVQHRAAPWSV